MKNLDCLFQEIDRFLWTRTKLTIGIDGNAASGKTTLAGLLAEKYQASVFHMDDFFLPQELKTEERLAVPGENIHWERFLEEVLTPLKMGEDIRYRKYDCKTTSYSPTITVKPQAVTIVEGVYSLHPRLSPNYDLTIFLSLNERIQKERLLRRENPQSFERYLTEWIPLENAYFAHLKPASTCHITLDDEDFL